MQNVERCCLALFIAGGCACAASLNRADKDFLNTAARMDMMDAHEGHMAEAQAVRTDAKDLAKTLVQDHSTSYSQIADLAAKKNVSIPKGIDSGKDPAIRQLGSLKGSRFDRQFATDEIAAQRQAIAVFKREAAKGEDPDVKAYASKALPTLEKDLKQAEAVAKSAPK